MAGPGFVGVCAFGDRELAVLEDDVDLVGVWFGGIVIGQDREASRY